MRYCLAAVFALFAMGAGAQNVSIYPPIVVRPTTVVASLPACTAGTRGAMYLVTDALVPVALATVANGGAVVTGVLCTGAAWIVQ